MDPYRQNHPHLFAPNSVTRLPSAQSAPFDAAQSQARLDRDFARALVRFCNELGLDVWKPGEEGNMDLRIEHAKKAEQPEPGWHTIEQTNEGERLAHVTSQGDAFCIQFFRPGELDRFDPRQMSDYERRAKRLAWCCLAEFGAPGPSRPARV